MTTKDQEKKGRTAKAEAKKAPDSKSAANKSGSSIGFLRAAEKAHIAVMDIPLDFFADLGMFPERVRSTKDLTRRFIGGMYNNLDSVSTKIGNTVSAPARLMRALTDKLQHEAAATKPKAQTQAAQADANVVAAKGKGKAKPKVKASAAKSGAKAVKPKARPKAATGVKAAKKAVKVANLPNPTGIH